MCALYYVHSESRSEPCRGSPPWCRSPRVSVSKRPLRRLDCTGRETTTPYTVFIALSFSYTTPSTNTIPPTFTPPFRRIRLRSVRPVHPFHHEKTVPDRRFPMFVPLLRTPSARVLPMSIAVIKAVYAEPLRDFHPRSSHPRKQSGPSVTLRHHDIKALQPRNDTPPIADVRSPVTSNAVKYRAKNTWRGGRSCWSRLQFILYD